MRAGKCMFCGAALPEGARRDRRYCEESCRAMAYRKRRGTATSEAARSPSGSRTASGTDLAPAVLAIAQQLKQLQQDMESVKKRLADLEAPTVAQSARPAPMVGQALEVVQVLQNLFGPGQTSRKPEPAVSSTPVAPAVPTAPVVPAAPAVPEASVPTPSVPPAAPSPPSEAPATKQPPWMAASPKDAAQFVPQWTLWSSDFLDRLNTYVERAIGSVPDVLAAQGETQAAEKMRQWLASDKPLALQVASLMARRIVATPLAARTSGQQRMDLARMVARDIQESLPIETPEDKPRMASMLAQEPRLPMLMGVFLTVALRSLAGVPVTSNV